MRKDNPFLKNMGIWMQHKDAIYRNCAEQLHIYSRFTSSIQGPLLDQDSCRIWAPLNDLIQAGYTKTKAEEVAMTIHSFDQEVIPALQSMESRVFSYASRITQVLSRIHAVVSADRAKERAKEYEDRKSHLSRSDAAPAKIAKLLDHLLTAVRELELEENEFENMSSLIPAELCNIELNGHFHHYLQQTSYLPVLMGIEAYLQNLNRYSPGMFQSNFEKTTPNTVYEEGQRFSKHTDALVNCAHILNVLEDESQSLCTDLLGRLSSKDQDAEARLTNILQVMETAPTYILVRQNLKTGISSA